MTAASSATGQTSEDVGLDARAVRKVIFASSLGTVFEWYDFYLYATLADGEFLRR